jgi:hypothetical protein
LASIWTNLPASVSDGLVEGVRSALQGLDGTLEATITPAVNPAYAEIVVRERQRWRGACLVRVAASAEDVRRAVRQSLRKPPRPMP